MSLRSRASLGGGGETNDTQDLKATTSQPPWTLGLLTSVSTCSGGQGSHCGGWRCSRQPWPGRPPERVRACAGWARQVRCRGVGSALGGGHSWVGAACGL